MMNIGKLTTLKTKNLAKHYIQIEKEKDLEEVAKTFKNTKDVLCFGGGSNLLFSYPVYENKTFIRNLQQGIESIDGETFKVKAGEKLSNFINYINRKFNNYALNPLYGIPGSIGGAVIGNAGCFGTEIGRSVEKIKYIDSEGNLKEENNYTYGYRQSNLGDENIILTEIIFHIPKIEENQVSPLKDYIKWRQEKHETKNTCGSFFKNPIIKPSEEKIIENILSFQNNPIQHKLNDEQIKIPTGWLVEKAGLKGFEYNGVKISDKHANFFLNYKNENPENILKLAEKVKERTYEIFGITLEEEVEII